jgi:hypothetical protein
VLITTRRALAGRPRQARYAGYHDEGQTCSRLSASLYQRSRKGRFRSGQTGQTVNLLALRLRWFESSPAHFLFHRRISLRDHVLNLPHSNSKGANHPHFIGTYWPFPKGSGELKAQPARSRACSMRRVRWSLSRAEWGTLGDRKKVRYLYAVLAKSDYDVLWDYWTLVLLRRTAVMR